MTTLRKLEGRRIVRADESPCRPHRAPDFLAPVLVLDDGTVVIVLSDAEGNRPGYLKIVSTPDSGLRAEQNQHQRPPVRRGEERQKMTTNEAGTVFGTREEILTAIANGAAAGVDDAGHRYEVRPVKASDGGILLGCREIECSDGSIFPLPYAREIE